jgi:hypothetical protein
LSYLSDEQLEALRRSAIADTFGGRFAVLREAGAGGMGRVYEAIDPSTRRRLAVKVIAHDTPPELARFAREAEVLERLSHPAIVAYVAHGTTPDGHPYLAMDWLDGESLSARLRRGKLPVGEAILVGRRVAEALAHAHAAGIVHRDLKPSNLILVDGDPAATVVVDFGVARAVSGADDLTRTGEVVGTPGYMPPEQARGGRAALDGRADLFALGCVLYQALTGQKPFEGEDVLEILSQLLLREPPPVAELEAQVPPRLGSLVAWLMAKDREARPASAALVAEELATVATALSREDRAVLETMVGPPATPDAGGAATRDEGPRARERRRRVSPLVAVLAIAGLAVALGATLLVARGRPGAPGSGSATRPVKDFLPPCSEQRTDGCERRCAEGDLEACSRAAYALAIGKGNTKDEAAGLARLRQLCSRGHGRSCRTASIVLFSRSWQGRSREWTRDYESLLDAGCQLRDGLACRYLAQALSTGEPQVLPRDPPRAFRLMQRGCELDQPYACRAQAKFLLTGYGTRLDRPGGLALLRSTCNRGDTFACRELDGPSSQPASHPR